MLYAPSENERILEAIAKYQEIAETDDAASFAFSLSNHHTFVGWLYCKPVMRPEAFKMFYELPIEMHFANSTIGTPTDFTASLATVLGSPAVMRYICSLFYRRPEITLRGFNTNVSLQEGNSRSLFATQQ